MTISFRKLGVSAVFAGALAGSVAAQECFLGEVRYFAGNFAPRNWALANGQLLAISNNQALFSILGTMYGGDGQTTFGLPDLRGRAPIGAGQGPGLSSFTEGAKGGAETTTLNTNNLPAHSHGLQASTAGGSTGQPSGNVLADTGRERVYGTASTLAPMASAAIGSTGAGQAFNSRDPYLAINPIICLFGIYPSRS